MPRACRAHLYLRGQGVRRASTSLTRYSAISWMLVHWLRVTYGGERQRTPRWRIARAGHGQGDTCALPGDSQGGKPPAVWAWNDHCEGWGRYVLKRFWRERDAVHSTGRTALRDTRIPRVLDASDEPERLPCYLRQGISLPRYRSAVSCLLSASRISPWRSSFLLEEKREMLTFL